MTDYDKGRNDATADYEWDKELGGRWLDLNLSDESIKNQLERPQNTLIVIRKGICKRSQN